MIGAAQERAARKRYKEMAPVLNEQSRRRFVALEAQALGRGQSDDAEFRPGAVDDLSGTVGHPQPSFSACWADPQRAIEDPTLVTHLKAIVVAVTRGDPTQPLLCDVAQSA